MSESRCRAREAPDEGTAHVDDLPDGLGCVEIWEALSDGREDDDGRR